MLFYVGFAKETILIGSFKYAQFYYTPLNMLCQSTFYEKFFEIRIQTPPQKNAKNIAKNFQKPLDILPLVIYNILCEFAVVA